jgi:superfamily II DNA/RNA helicase
MSQNLAKEPFKFNSPLGWRICRKIIQEKPPFRPHDYQLDGITHALDRQDVITISATGSGKSAYIYMLATVLVALGKDPSLVLSKRVFSRDPVLVVVCPTTALEEDLVCS